jgi:uncharacterized membrane protein YvbJ
MIYTSVQTLSNTIAFTKKPIQMKKVIVIAVLISVLLGILTISSCTAVKAGCPATTGKNYKVGY